MIRIASVSYLNARPLIHGLDGRPDVRLTLDVPARLLELLQGSRCDVALLPVIDLLSLDRPQMLQAGGIGCEGATLTVRLFSRVPLESATSLACDPDSHTSVQLARIIFKHRFSKSIELTSLDHANRTNHDTLLLIGDKVINDAPRGYDHQLDLGQAWKDLTGMPFVFAIWTARSGVEVAPIESLLRASLDAGLQSIEQILDQHAEQKRWPRDIARKYLTEYLHFRIGPRQVEAIKRFHQLATSL